MHPEDEPIGTWLCQDGQTGKRWKRPGDADSDASNNDCTGLQVGEMQSGIFHKKISEIDGDPWDEHWYEAAARLCRVDDGISSRVDGIGVVSPQSENKSKAAGRGHRLKAIGNSIVPQVAAQIMRAIKAASGSMMKG